MKTHMRDIRLRNNAGMDFPLCKAGAELLDLDAGRWPLTGKYSEVTCAHCRRHALDTAAQWLVRSIKGSHY